MPDRFDGATSKLRRGYEHLDGFKRVLQDFADSQPHRIIEERDGESRRWQVELVQPLPHNLPLIVGDCVQNYRAALDYIAFEVALRGGLNRRDQGRVSFPITARNSRPRKPRPGARGFDDLELGRYFGTQELAFLKRFQPFRNPPVRQNRLRILNQLSNRDKHRRLGFMHDIVFGNSIPFAADGKWHFYTENRRIRPGGRASFNFPVNPTAVLTSGGLPESWVDAVNDRLQLYVLFDNRTGYVGGRPVIQVLRRIGAQVEEILDAAKTEFA